MNRQCAWAAMASLALTCAFAAPPPNPLPTAASNPAQTKANCGTAAAKWFKEHFPEPDEHTKAGWAQAAYTSHFSAAKGRCFMEVIATAHIEKNPATTAGDTEMHHLVDLQVGQEIGRLVLVSNTAAPFVICEVGNAKCSNVPGWNALIAPYMNDSGTDDRRSVLLKIKNCFGNATEGDSGNRSSCWMPNASTVLSGISQAEIISVLGPPTWCHAPDGVVTHKKEACSANEVAGWSFPSEPPANQVGGGIELVCDPGKDLRCSRVHWIADQ